MIGAQGPYFAKGLPTRRGSAPDFTILDSISSAFTQGVGYFGHGEIFCLRESRSTITLENI